MQNDQIFPNDHLEDERYVAKSFYTRVQIFPKALHSETEAVGTI